VSGWLFSGNDVCQGATILIQLYLTGWNNFKIKRKFVPNIQNILLLILTVGVKSFVGDFPLNLNLRQYTLKKRWWIMGKKSWMHVIKEVTLNCATWDTKQADADEIWNAFSLAPTNVS